MSAPDFIRYRLVRDEVFNNCFDKLCAESILLSKTGFHRASVLLRTWSEAMF